MAGNELSRTVDSQIYEIFANNPLETPHMARFRRCSLYIQRAKEALLKMPEFFSRAAPTYFTNEPGKLAFSVGLDNYIVEYYTRGVANIEENFTLTVNDEKIRLHTYMYEDGRVNSSILYFSDAPDFMVEKYLEPEPNEREALRILESLEEKSSL